MIVPTAERTQSIDWFRVIVDLERGGYSHERIAAECLRSKGWVSNLKSIPGTEPRHRDGAVLLALWSEATGRRAVQAPRTSEVNRSGTCSARPRH